MGVSGYSRHDQLPPAVAARTHHPRCAPRAGATGKAGGESSLGPHLVDFWTNVCICQSLIIEEPEEEGGLPIYQVRPWLAPGGFPWL